MTRSVLQCVLVFATAVASSFCFAADSATLVIPKITKPLVEAVENDPLQADYDKMWTEYEEAVRKATATVKESLDKQIAKATDSGELDLVEMWEGKQKQFAEKGRLEWDTGSKASVEWKKTNPKVPYPREFNEAVRSASSGFASAKEKLEEGYADLVKAYTKAKNVPRAKELRDEGAAVIAGTLVAVLPTATVETSVEPAPMVREKKGGGVGPGEGSTTRSVCRVTFSISEKGDCRLRAEKTASPSGKTERVKQSDGTWVCNHYFAAPSDIGLFDSPFGPVVNVRVDEEQKYLLFEAAPAKGFDRKASQVTYPTRFRVPFEVSIDLTASGNDFMFQINPMPTQLGQRQAIVNIKSDDALKNSVKVSVGSMTRDAQGKPNFFPQLLEEQTISLEKPWETSFRLPVPNVRSRDAYNLRLGVIGESGVSASSLTVSGMPVPSIGIKLGEKSGVVFAENVVPNSLADKATIQSGDVLSAISGKTPASVNEAMEMLADMPLNEATAITIQRGDSKKTVRITPTFGN